MKNSYLLTRNSITLIIDGEVRHLSKDHQFYNQILEEIHKEDIDWQKISTLMNIRKSIINYVGENLEIQGNEFIWKNGNETLKVENNALVTRILDGYNEGRDVQYLINFFNRVLANPLESARQELFLFLEANELPITNEGLFLAYKKVTINYKDCHTRTFDNSIGKIVNMPRKDCDTDRAQTCSYGLHFCSSSYLNCFGGDRTIIVEVDPADVVAIPNDYNNAKGRTWRYRVVGECIDGDYNLKTFMETKYKPSTRKVVVSDSEEVVDYNIEKPEGFNPNLPVYTTTEEARKKLKPRQIGKECYIYKVKTNEYRLYRFVNGTANKNLIWIK